MRAAASTWPHYQRAKTGALFAAATMAGAAAAGAVGRALAPARRAAGRGLPGRRRHPRRRVRRRASSASRSAGTRRSAARARSRELGLRRRGRAARAAGRPTRSTSIPACPGAADAARPDPARGQRFLPEGAGARRRLSRLARLPRAAHDAGVPSPRASAARPLRWPCATGCSPARRFRRWAARFPADPADRAPAGAGAVRSRAPASSIRRCCSPACGCACSTSCRRAADRGDAGAAARPAAGGAPSGCCAAAVRAATSSRAAAAAASALGPLGAAMVGNPGVAAMVEHHALLYADLADPVALLRGAARRAPSWRATGPMPAPTRPGRAARRTQVAALHAR